MDGNENIFSMADLRESFSKTPLKFAFASRSSGKAAAVKLAKFMEGNPRETAIVSWNGVNAVSPSFVDEMMAQITEFMQDMQDRTELVFTVDDHYVRYVLNAVLRRRNITVRYFQYPASIGVAEPGYMGKEIKRRRRARVK